MWVDGLWVCTYCFEKTCSMLSIPTKISSLYIDLSFKRGLMFIYISTYLLLEIILCLSFAPNLKTLWKRCWVRLQCSQVPKRQRLSRKENGMSLKAWVTLQSLTNYKCFNVELWRDVCKMSQRVFQERLHYLAPHCAHCFWRATVICVVIVVKL